MQSEARSASQTRAFGGLWAASMSTTQFERHADVDKSHEAQNRPVAMAGTALRSDLSKALGISVMPARSVVRLYANRLAN